MGACPSLEDPRAAKAAPPTARCPEGSDHSLCHLEALASGLEAPRKALGKEKLEARGLSTPTRAEQLFMGPTTELTLTV